MKFLTDAQTRQKFVEMLRRLGHEVTTAKEQGLHREKDYRLVAWAHSLGHMFITFDALRGQSGMEVAREIKTNGGRVIYIGGGPEQEPERALGRFLFHWPEWFPHLREHSGLVEISDTKHNIRWYPASRIQQRVRKAHRPAFDEYLKKRAEARMKPLKRSRRRRAHPQQPALDTLDGAV